MKWQRELCQSLNLMGRILIAKEGINGTLGGSIESIEHYKLIMSQHELFGDIDFKEGQGGASHFPKLKVIVKNEIVKLGLDPEMIKAEDGGIHLTPEQVHELIQSNQDNDDFVVLDTRNDYESKIGIFTNAIPCNIKAFREFPQFIDQNIETFKGKKVLMYCTGGIRCERATAYLKLKNVAAEIYQIQGGIHRYIEAYPDGFFRGKNYVFDGRIATAVTNDILAQCEHCQITYDEYTNCFNAECNRQIIVCPPCIEIYHNTCSEECRELVLNLKVNVRKKSR
jgi:predicted sulfurtransferase